MGRKRDRTGWGGFWFRAVLIAAVFAMPLVAGLLLGSSVSGNAWLGVLKGNRSAARQGNADIRNGNGSRQDGQKSSLSGFVDFGSLSVGLYDPITRGQLKAGFNLEGVVVLDDDPARQKIAKNKYRFIREQAVIAVRSSNGAEMDDPQLKLLQRRVLIRINRSLDRPLLKSVALSQFRLVETSPELDLLGDDVISEGDNVE